jgi:hypothetical protein
MTDLDVVKVDREGGKKKVQMFNGGEIPCCYFFKPSVVLIIGHQFPCTKP